jgi:hypothetical protein
MNRDCIQQGEQSMNDARRKAIAEFADRIVGLKTDIEILRDKEQEAFDNMPEGLQQAERGEKMEAAIQSLEDAIDSLEQAESSLEEAAQ